LRNYPECERNAVIIGLYVETVQSAEGSATFSTFQSLSAFQHEQHIRGLLKPEGWHRQGHTFHEPLTEFRRRLCSLRRMNPCDGHRSIDYPTLTHRRPSSIADFTSA